MSINTILATQGYDTADKRIALYKQIADALVYNAANCIAPSVVCIVGPSSSRKSMFGYAITKVIAKCGVQTVSVANESTPPHSLVRDKTLRCCVDFDLRQVPFFIEQGLSESNVESFLYLTDDAKIADSIAEWNTDSKIKYLRIDFTVSTPKLVHISHCKPTKEMTKAFQRIENNPFDIKTPMFDRVMASQGFDESTTSYVLKMLGGLLPTDDRWEQIETKRF